MPILWLLPFYDIGFLLALSASTVSAIMLRSLCSCQYIEAITKDFGPNEGFVNKIWQC